MAVLDGELGTVKLTGSGTTKVRTSMLGLLLCLSARQAGAHGVGWPPEAFPTSSLLAPMHARALPCRRGWSG